MDRPQQPNTIQDAPEQDNINNQDKWVKNLSDRNLSQPEMT